MIFRFTHLWQIATLDIFQKVLLRNLDSSTSLYRPFFMTRFYLFLSKQGQFWSFHAFSKKRKAETHFPDNQSKNISALFYLFAYFPFTTSELELNHDHQKLNVRVASPVDNDIRLRRILGSEEILEKPQIECRYRLVPCLPSGKKNWQQQ